MQSRKKRWPIIVVILMLGYAAPAGAMFGEENIPLLRILVENIQQTFHLAELAERITENLELMRDTARMARASTDVNGNVQALLKDPERRFRHIVQMWADESDVLGPAWATASALRELNHKDSRTDVFSSFSADNRAADAFERLNYASFQELTHVANLDSITDPHDRSIAVLRTQYALALGNLESLAVSAQKSGGIRPVEASVWTAQATSVAAVATVKTSATVEHIAHTMNQKDTKAEADKQAALQESARQEKYLREGHLKSWRLRPTVGQ